MTPDDIHKEAKLRVEEKQKFRYHVRMYMAMMVFFFLVNVFSSPGVWWFYWPMLGWGLGLFGHYQKVYGALAMNGKSDWERRQYEKEIKQLEGHKNNTKPREKPLDLEEEPLELEDFKELRKDWDDSEIV